MSSIRGLRSDLNPALPKARRAMTLPLSYSSIGHAVAAVDLLLITGLSVATGVLYHLASVGKVGDLGNYIGSGLAVAVLFVTSAQARSLYRPAQLLALKTQLRAVSTIWTLVFFCLASIAFALKIGGVFSRATVILFLIDGIIGVVVVRLLVSRLLQAVTSSGSLNGQRIVVLGEPSVLAGDELTSSLKRHGYVISQTFSIHPVAAGSTVAAAVAERLSELVAFVRRHEVDEIVLALSWSDADVIQEIVAALRVLPLPIKLVPDSHVGKLLSRPVCEMGPTMAVELQRAPLSGFDRAAKQVMDVTLASIGLVLLTPLLLVVAVAIRVDSPGPVFFRQTRIGFSGRPFRIYKFRTMTTLEDGPEVRQASKDDARVTRVGRWLRRASIDELPQLLNVLKGEMSLVGPRPHALAHDNEYDKLIANYAMRHHMKPGITGWAQVNGFRGETPDVSVMQRRVEHDLWYIAYRSLWLDLIILIRTVFQQIRMSSDVY